MTDSVPPAEAASEDPYRSLCRGMTPGLLLTVNDSDPTTPGFDEMKVTRVDDTGRVYLTQQSSTRQFVLTHDEPNASSPVMKEIGETEFAPRHEPVTTIEVLGIAE